LCDYIFTIKYFDSRSGVFLRDKDFTEFLSDIKRDEFGNITGASATIINWISTMNMTEALNNSVVYGPEPITAKTYAFEGKIPAYRYSYLGLITHVCDFMK